MPTHEHTLVFRNNHLFVRLEEGLFLLDTGCPLSHGPAENATIFGRTANIPSEFMGLPFEHVTRLAGPECVGMIGMDLLCDRHSYWDGPNCRLVGGDVPLPVSTNAAVAEFGMGIIFNASASGNPLRVLLDTGAQYGYLTSADLANGAEPAGIIHDFNPLLGEMESESWWVEVERIQSTPRCSACSGTRGEIPG